MVGSCAAMHAAAGAAAVAAGTLQPRPADSSPPARPPQICGTANIQAMEAAHQAGVPRFAFISVHDFKLPAGWQAQQFMLRGCARRQTVQRRCCLPTPAAGFLHGPHPALTCSPSQRAGMPDCSYFQGKRDAERRLAELYPQGGVALRPGIISGTRQVVPPAPACHLQPASTCALPAGWDLPYCEQRRCSLLR